MKRLINIFIIIASLTCMVISCEKVSEDVSVSNIDPALAGEWHLTSASAEGSDIHSALDIYLCIKSDCTFELFQKSGSQSVRYDRYTGTCTSENGILSGIYSDGNPWGNKYIYSATAKELVLTSFNLIEEQKYERTEIPQDVREKANIITKSSSEENTPIL